MVFSSNWHGRRTAFKGINQAFKTCNTTRLFYYFLRGHGRPPKIVEISCERHGPGRALQYDPHATVDLAGDRERLDNESGREAKLKKAEAPRYQSCHRST